MLQATLRRVGLRLELSTNSSLRHFIHSSHCATGATKKQHKTRSTEPSVKTPLAKERTRARIFVEPPPENVETFLHKLESEKDILTIDDVERYRPSTIPDTRSSHYESEYNDALNTLTRSFNLVTFRKIFELYNIPQLSTPLQKKNSYAQALLVFWGWKSLSEVKEDISDTTKSSELRFPLSSEEAFLLMGKDGFDFLNLAKRYGVHLSFTDYPISLKAKGLQGSLKRLKGYLNSFKNDIQREMVQLPLDQFTPLEITKSISRLSGAFLSPEDDKFRISFHKNQPRALEIVKRLAAQVSSRETLDINRPIFFHSGSLEGHSTDSSLYSLYPFTPQERLPWVFSSNSSFRLRRIGHWMDSGIPANMLSNGQMPGGSFNSSEIFSEDLKSRLLNEVTSESTCEVTARVGHFLFMSPSQEQTLLPPVNGKLSEEDAIQWARNHPDRISFNYNIPATISISLADKEQLTRKLVYAEQMALNDQRPRTTLHLEIPERTEDVHANLDLNSEILAPQCYISTESTIDILCPDLPTDMQLSAIDKRQIIPSDLPDELSAVLASGESRLLQNSTIPFTCIFNGVIYQLTTDERVYRQFKSLTLDDTRVNIVTEISTDVDINQQHVLCKIICEDHQSPDGWKSFLDIFSKVAVAM